MSSSEEFQGNSGDVLVRRLQDPVLGRDLTLDHKYTSDSPYLQDTQRPILPHLFCATTRSSVWDDVSTLAPSLRSTDAGILDPNENIVHNINRKPIPNSSLSSIPRKSRPNILLSPVEPNAPPSDSTLSYLRTHQDNQPQHIRKKQKDLTKTAIRAAKTEKSNLRTTHLLDQARSAESRRAHVSHHPTPSLPSFLTPHHIFKSLSLCISLVLFQIGLNSTLVLLTIIVARIRSHEIVTLLGEELVFGMVISIGIMGVGVIWGTVLMMRYGIIRKGERGGDLFGLWEVSMPGKGGGVRGRRGLGDLEAGFGVREGVGMDNKGKRRVIRLCVCPEHRDGVGEEKGSVELDSKPRAGNSSNTASTSRPGPSGSKPATTSPPIPSISIRHSPIQNTAEAEQAELTQFILPHPPATCRSSMRSRPYSRVYTQNIQLDSLRPDVSSAEKRKEKTLSLQLRDMPEIENPRGKRTRSTQEVEDDIFIIGEDKDD